MRFSSLSPLFLVLACSSLEQQGERGAIQTKDRLRPTGDRTTHTIRYNGLTGRDQRGASAPRTGYGGLLCDWVARYIATSVGQVIPGYKCRSGLLRQLCPGLLVWVSTSWVGHHLPGNGARSRSGD
jgi:hypothetical protein